MRSNRFLRLEVVGAGVMRLRSRDEIPESGTVEKRGSDDRRFGSSYRWTRPGAGEGGVRVPVLGTGPGAVVVVVPGTVTGVAGSVVVVLGSCPRISMSQISAEWHSGEWPPLMTPSSF